MATCLYGETFCVRAQTPADWTDFYARGPQAGRTGQIRVFCVKRKYKRSFCVSQQQRPSFTCHVGLFPRAMTSPSVVPKTPRRAALFFFFFRLLKEVND